MQQLHPKAKWLFFISALWKMALLLFFFWPFIVVPIILPAIFVGSVSSNPWLWIAGVVSLIPVLLWLGLSYVWAWLTYSNWRYELADLGFKKESGIIWKSYVTIPYSRIQNVDIYRGFWARVLGLSDVHIQTAGQSSAGRYGQARFAEGRLPGLLQTDAESLRDELVRRSSHTNHPSGL